MIDPTDWWLFDLTRFDDSDADETEQTTETGSDGEPEETGDDQGNPGDDGTDEEEPEDEKPKDKKDDDSDGLGDKGKRALDRMKAEKLAAQREAKQANRALAAAQKKVAEFENRDKSDLEKKNAEVETLRKSLAAATARSVQAEVKAFAADRFADPSDAAAFLELQKYADEDGEIDVEQIRADIDDLLESKPHLRKPEPVEQPRKPAKPKPKPDPSQGSRGGEVKTDYRTADRETVDAKLSEYGYRSRTRRM